MPRWEFMFNESRKEEDEKQIIYNRESQIHDSSSLFVFLRLPLSLRKITKSLDICLYLIFNLACQKRFRASFAKRFN